MQRVTVQRVTVSATGYYLSSLYEEHRHIADPSATGNHLRSIQGSICNICRLARTVENKIYLINQMKFGTRVQDTKLK